MKNKIIYLCLFILYLSVFLDAKTKIAVVKTADVPLYNEVLKGIEDHLKTQGFADKIDYYIVDKIEAGGEEKILKDVNVFKPDIIVTIGTKATKLLSSIKETPIVFSFVSDPVKEGLVKSMDTSGNNLTGVVSDVSPAEQFRILKLALPNVRKVALVYSSENSNIVKDGEIASKNFGIELKKHLVSSKKDALETLNKISDVDVLWAIMDPVVWGDADIISYAVENITLNKKIPILGFSENFVKGGFLLGLYADGRSVGLQTGEILSKILQGVQPKDIPIQYPKKTKLAVNEKVAKVLGINLTSEVIKKADVLY